MRAVRHVVTTISDMLRRHSVAFAVAALLPFLFRAKWRKDGHGEEPRPASLALPGLLLVRGLLGFVEQRSADIAGGACSWRTSTSPWRPTP
jgi:hypothetical protein